MKATVETTTNRAVEALRQAILGVTKASGGFLAAYEWRWSADPADGQSGGHSSSIAGKVAHESVSGLQRAMLRGKGQQTREALRLAVVVGSGGLEAWLVPASALPGQLTREAVEAIRPSCRFAPPAENDLTGDANAAPPPEEAA